MNFDEIFARLGIVTMQDSPVDDCINVVRLVEQWQKQGVVKDENHTVYLLTPSDTYIGGNNGASQSQIIRIRGKLYKVSHNSIWTAARNGIWATERFKTYVEYEYVKETVDCKKLEEAFGGYKKRG